MPTPTRAGVAVLAAALLSILSLGLPWTTSTQDYQAGWYVPGMCMPSGDEVWCAESFISPGTLTISPALSGAGTVARVFLVATLVLIVLARVRQEREWLAVAAAGLVLGVLLTGLAAQGGQLAALLAAALLGYAWARPRTSLTQAHQASG